MLLGDEKIAKACGLNDVQFVDGYERSIAEAQLAHCEPLIRADERAKVAQEIISEIEKNIHFGHKKHCSVYKCDQDCPMIIFTDKCIWWKALKAEYGVKD